MAETAVAGRPLGALNRILAGDCVEEMRKLADGSVDLVFADPPFNIGYDYDVYHDKKEYEHYLAWSRDWIGAVHRVLKPGAPFVLAMAHPFAAVGGGDSRRPKS